MNEMSETFERAVFIISHATAIAGRFGGKKQKQSNAKVQIACSP